MGMRELNTALDLIKNHPNDDCYFSGPKSEEFVLLAEATLDVKFSPTYRSFLLKLGCGNIAGEEFYGLTKNTSFTNSSIPNGIWLTLEQRETSGIPNSFIVIYATGDGAYFAIDSSICNSEEESPVVVWHPGLSKPESIPERIADDFGAFFLTCITEAIEPPQL